MTNDPILCVENECYSRSDQRNFQNDYYFKKDDLLSEFTVFHCVDQYAMQMCLHYVVVVISIFVCSSYALGRFLLRTKHGFHHLFGLRREGRQHGKYGIVVSLVRFVHQLVVVLFHD